MATVILTLENEHILQAVKSSRRTTRTPTVANNYRIMKAAMKEDIHGELHTYNQQFLESIRLDTYYKLPSEVFHQDLHFLVLLDSYINVNGFPKEPVPAPERSAELVGNEKWIDEKGGKEILERVHLWNSLKIMPVSRSTYDGRQSRNASKSEQLHFIVENKTTYQALLSFLRESVFSALIYGCGNKIVKSIEQFEWQLPMTSVKHTFFYFGDIDKSGLAIWHALNKKQHIKILFHFTKLASKKKLSKEK